MEVLVSEVSEDPRRVVLELEVVSRRGSELVSDSEG